MYQELGVCLCRIIDSQPVSCALMCLFILFVTLGGAGGLVGVGWVWGPDFWAVALAAAAAEAFVAAWLGLEAVVVLSSGTLSSVLNLKGSNPFTSKMFHQ